MTAMILFSDTNIFPLFADLCAQLKIKVTRTLVFLDLEHYFPLRVYKGFQSSFHQLEPSKGIAGKDKGKLVMSGNIVRSDANCNYNGTQQGLAFS